MLSYGEGLIRITALSCTNAHRGSLVDNNDAFPVAEPVDLLRIGVVACAEGIGMDPVQEVDILYIEAEIQSSSAEKGILMLAEAFEIKRLAIDQKLRSFHLYGTETEFLYITVIPVMDFGFVQVRSARVRLPEMGLRDPKLSFPSGGFRLTVPFCIYDL